MLMELVKKLNVTVISAIHDLNIAAAYCDKIYVLKDGVLEGYGTPQEVLTPELIKRIYRVDSEVVNDSRGKMHIYFYNIRIDRPESEKIFRLWPVVYGEKMMNKIGIFNNRSKNSLTYR